MLGADLDDRLAVVASDGAPVSQLRPAAPAGQEAEALAAALLQQRPPSGDALLWVALSPPAVAEFPGELLGRLRAAGYGVQGFVDRAALLAAWLPDAGTLAVLALSRRAFSISLAARDGELAGLRRHVTLPGGESAIHDAWLRLAAATLVQRTRFDPLHDLHHEAALRAQLPALAAAAQRDGQAQCELDTGNGMVTLALTRDQFAVATAALLTPVAGALQALSAAHGDGMLLVPASLREIPGIEAAWNTARFAQQAWAPDDLAARAASLLAPTGVAGAGGVPYRTRLPVFTTQAVTGADAMAQAGAGAAATVLLQPLAHADHQPGAMATHVVFRGRVLLIPATGLVLGRDPGTGTVLQLPEGVAGLSRRHCTLQRDGARTQVIDHSSHGTFVDGGRVRGRALLPAGATLRLGDPGIELPLVAIGTE